MRNDQLYNGGENFDLRQMFIQDRNGALCDRLHGFQELLNGLSRRGECLCRRCIGSASDRTVLVEDPATGRQRTMLMFGSNNYLGLANHPSVRSKTIEAINAYGVGVGGPPLLNGYTALHRHLEERLAEFKSTGDAMIFSTGYGANVGLVSALAHSDDTVCYDSFSHASFVDGMKMAGIHGLQFPHNDMPALERLLASRTAPAGSGDCYIGVEGAYSMDGDLAPLDELVRLKKAHRAILIVDDAHGTGVMGTFGHGTAEHFGVENAVDITVGTFSKVFAATGGFVAGSKPLIDYLRYFARSYMFSASLPPPVIATVLAGLDVIEREPELLQRLRENCAHLAAGLRSLGFPVQTESAIFPLMVPAGMDIRKAGVEFHELGIFVNSVEYPAVPLSQQRFRISVMANHTHEDIDRLLEAIDHVWKKIGSTVTPLITDVPAHA